MGFGSLEVLKDKKGWGVVRLLAYVKPGQVWGPFHKWPYFSFTSSNFVVVTPPSKYVAMFKDYY
jgi:hypothetical protein